MVTSKTHDVGSPDGQYLQGKRPSQSSSDNVEGSEEHRSLKDRFKSPFPELREKLKDSHLYDVKVGAIHLKHRIGKLENLVNTNHRHDEEHEQQTDAKRIRIGESHRFQSFAPERDGNQIKWYVDGRDYYHAVSVALERASETIYIADWWLSPELFLRRPPHFNQKWRLDATLKRAAERGVKIYIIVYKEVKQALTCNSQHTKRALEALCPKGTPGHGNIVVMRHPDHNFFENAGDMTFYWAHHEKFINIDYNLAFIGGLDLCFGRWDTKQHPLADAHPGGVQHEVFPGQDFNNNRIMDFQTVEDWESNELSKTEYGRMPWHDVAMGVIGPCIYDIAEHFVLRWNFCKRDKYKRDPEYDWLTLQGRTGEHEDLVGVQRPKHPVGDYILHPLGSIEKKAGYPRQGRLVPRGGDGQAGEGADYETDTFHDAQEQLDEHGYTPEQHRLGRAKKYIQEFDARLTREETEDGIPEDSKPDGTGDTSDDVRKQENPKMTGNEPEKEGTVTASGGVLEKSKSYSSSHVIESETRGGHGPIHAQLVRSSADWSSGILTEQSIQNAYCQVIRGAKHFVYIENQFFITATGDKQAPIHNLIGAAIVDACANAAKEGRKFRVIIVIPSIPGFAGDLRSDAATGTRAIMDYQYKSICRGEHSIYGRLKAQGVDPTKYVFIFNLRSYDRINKTPGLKAKEEQSGVNYRDVQRAQADEVMGGSLEGGPHEKKKGQKLGLHHRKAGGERPSGGEQPTSVKGAAKKTAQAPVDGESSESESDMEEDYHQGGTNAATDGRSGADKKRQFEEAAMSTEEGRDEEVQSVDSIAKDALLGEKKVSEENYAGRSPGTGMRDDSHELASEESKKMAELREQEKENFVQEELYIHGKVSI